MNYHQQFKYCILVILIYVVNTVVSRRPTIADQQITWFYANSLDDGAAFLNVFGEEVLNLKQKDECRIFRTAVGHFCGVCNTRRAPSCKDGGPEGPSAQPVTYTLVVKNSSRVNEYYEWFNNNNNNNNNNGVSIITTKPDRSEKYAVYAFNFYDKNIETGLGCYRFEVQTFFDPAWPSMETATTRTKERINDYIGTIQFASSFGDHMVLQREPYVAKIWGTATMNDTSSSLIASSLVMVSLYTTSSYNKKNQPLHIVNASIDLSSGEWIATLPTSIKGSASETYIVTAQLLLSQSKSSSSSSVLLPSSSTIIKLVDILFGDVFVASGQSNMAFLLKNAFNGSVLVQDANNYPNIRLFTSKKIASKIPLNQQPEVEEKWSIGSNISVVMQKQVVEDDNWLYMSALAWTFARRVYQTTNIPIGILNTNWGGTPIEFWMSEDAMKACPSPPSSPSSSSSSDDDDSQSPTQGWNGMIVPLLRTTIRGVIWFQGENNSGQKHGALLYKCRFPKMISDWRKKFSSFEYFGFVQLASYISNLDVPGIRWAQTAGYGYVPNEKMPHTYMSSAIDLGDKTSPYGSVHSRHKQELGARLGDQALNFIFDIKLENIKRPMLSSVERHFDGTSFFLTFKNTNAVYVRNASVGWEICDPNVTKCVAGAVTSVNSSTVLLKSMNNNEMHMTTSNTLIRYLWASYACELLSCSLYGPGSPSEALPVVPFEILV